MSHLSLVQDATYHANFVCTLPAVFSGSTHVIMRSSLRGFASTAWRNTTCSGVRSINYDFTLTGFRVQCFSSRRARASQLPEVKRVPSKEEERDAFYVVRKGDIIGIYSSLSYCQAQVSSSVCDPPVSVYKGYSLREEAEQYLASKGLKNAMYAIDAGDLKDDIFGTLFPCPFQQPNGLDFLVDNSSGKTSLQKRSTEKVDSSMPCIIEFDGASKGNPGRAGAGAILRTEDGTVICKLREGLGVVTCNVAEYRALLLGLKYALKKGFMQIHVQGDSTLVCMQVNNLWKTKHINLVALGKEVKGLKQKFLTFNINHVRREFNSDADAQANLAVELPDGEVYEELG